MNNDLFLLGELLSGLIKSVHKINKHQQECTVMGIEMYFLPHFDN